MFGGITSNIQKGDVMRYMFMPQIAPRLNAFYQTGFSYLAYMIALVYRGVNILPANHRIFSREYHNKMTIRMVLGAAASELKFSKAHIDQIIIYFAVIIGMIMLVGQFFLTLSYLMMNPAFAGMPTNYAGFFAAPDYQNDVAYKLLFTVFGVPELFNPTGTVQQFHTALHSLFQFYSIGLLVVAVFITIYFIFAIIAETAQTGVPFGKRYNHAWAPIRLVMALGMLIPMGYGLNAAQWVTLYAAKFGSDFATRGWVIFNESMADSYLAEPQRIGVPKPPDIAGFLAFLSLVQACEYGYEALQPEREAAGAGAPGDGGSNGLVDYWLVKSTAEQGGPPLRLATANDDLALVQRYFNNGDALIRFGVYNATEHTEYRGGVYPACGDLVVFFPAQGASAGAGVFNIARWYYLQTNWQLSESQSAASQNFLLYNGTPIGELFMQKHSGIISIANPNVELPGPEFKRAMIERAEFELTREIRNAALAQAGSDLWLRDAAAGGGAGAGSIAGLGWGAAGVWYNKIAQLNGSLVTAVHSVPRPRQLPAVMEYVKQEQLQQNTNVGEQGQQNLSGQREVQIHSVDDKLSFPLSQLSQYWTAEDTRQDGVGSQTKRTSNIFIDTVNLVFGTQGLFNMCANAEVHPLAQLSVLGKGLVESSIRNLGMAVGLGGLSMLPLPFIGAAGGAAASMLLSVATVTLSMGFILYYVLPFMPFLYFFFAVGGWIKGLFEAMVGVPLWALAHIRIDGEGLPGDAAMSGYYLVFEIFLRPILIIFGLLASVIIFGAMVKVLNEIFSLVVSNLSGHDPVNGTVCGAALAGGGAAANSADPYFRGPIDELFYTVIYAIIVYMIGMSCFKLIDLIPNNILRYMNASVSTFNDAASDPAQGLMRNISIGSSQVSGQVIGIAKGGGDTIKGIVQQITQSSAGPQQ